MRYHIANCSPLDKPSDTARETVRAGEVIVLQIGEWEQTATVAVLIAQRDFDPVAEVEKFVEAERAAGRIDEDICGPGDAAYWDDEKAGYDYNPHAELVKSWEAAGLVVRASPTLLLHLRGYDWEN